MNATLLVRSAGQVHHNHNPKELPVTSASNAASHMAAAITVRRAIPRSLVQYVASSYPAYINQAEAPTWLHRKLVLSALNTTKKHQAYQAFVEHDNEQGQAMNDFYAKAHQPTVLGTKEFAAKIKRHASEDVTEIVRHRF